MCFRQSLLALAFFSLVAALISSCGRPAKQEDGAVFEDVAEASGLRFHHFNGALGGYYMPEIVGAGAALFDYDNDGDLDVVLVQGDFIVPPKPGETILFPLPADQQPGSRLFRNELVPAGKLAFVDVTEASGLNHTGVGMGVATGDIDNDGDLDLYVTAYGPNRLYRNDGGRFTDISKTSGAGDDRWSTSATFFDYDRDGWIDLFVTTYVDFSPARHQNCRSQAGEKDYCGPKSYNGQTGSLFRNLGRGQFQDVSRHAGLNAIPGPGLGVAAMDFDGDGWQDMYVANDGEPNHLWMNQRNGRFVESGLSMGMALADSGTPRAGMGVASADVDHDGRLDVIVTNLTNEGATLFVNGDRNGVMDVSDPSGVNVATNGFTGFGVGWLDSTNSGKLDLFIANGAVRLERPAPGSAYPYGQRNQFLRQVATRKWVDASAAAGAVFRLEEVSRAAVFGDIDNDGGVDILVTNNNGPVRLLMNRTGKRTNWLLVRVDAGPENRFGDGTRLEFRRAGQPAIWRSVQRGYSYLAANDPRVHVGLGDSAGAVTIVVHWPDGASESLPAGPLNRILDIKRIAHPR
ncbi:MAG: CRTAC1 family protein [Acidobacteriia bacterium]|nr:CRTAC1 family protein [Terriglobia bacterium]